MKCGRLDASDGICSDAVLLHFFRHSAVQCAFESFVVNARDELTFREVRIAAEKLLQVNGNGSRHPTTAVNDVWRPAQLLHGLKDASCEENGALVVVFK